MEQQSIMNHALYPATQNDDPPIIITLGAPPTHIRPAPGHPPFFILSLSNTPPDQSDNIWVDDDEPRLATHFGDSRHTAREQVVVPALGLTDGARHCPE